jgi:integrase
MRNRRFQKPTIKNIKGYWVAQYYDLDGIKRKTSLGPVKNTSKAEAEGKLAKILEPINSRTGAPSASLPFGHFVRQHYLPFFERKWKRSTTLTNRDRIRSHLTAEFGEQSLGSFDREGLQAFLDRKAALGLSRSVIAHLRWDLRQIFEMAVAEGYLDRNPAKLLFVPRNARQPKQRVMTLDQVKVFLSVFELREQVICGFATLAGMRPGEIFALKRRHVEGECADIDQRIYRGEIDTPKTTNSRRLAALGGCLRSWLDQWLEKLPDTDPEAWLFPSEKLITPVSKDNCWRRNCVPRLKPVGLQWANFQVMRRTHSSLSDDLGIDPQVRADQMGHTVDVNQNKYTKSSVDRRRAAVNRLEKALKLT